MITTKNVICRFCYKMFCCIKCWEKHANKVHSNEIHKRNSTSPSSISQKDLMCCPICECKPLVLYVELPTKIIKHIEQNHLPLHCQKCSKLYENIEDLQQFSKCVQHADCPVEEKIAEEQIQVPPSQLVPKDFFGTMFTVGTQTSPAVQSFCNTAQQSTQVMTLLNPHWKQKNEIFIEESNVDSVSSLKNISSINSSSRRSIGFTSSITTVKGKLVRSTSTPLSGGSSIENVKVKGYNSTYGHVSSIHSNASQSYVSPPLLSTTGTPLSKPLPIGNKIQYRKVKGRSKKNAITPLRHVMSKSIQKAIAEHTSLHGRIEFDFVDTSSGDRASSPRNSPLDLRMSPVIRRTQSEVVSPSAPQKHFNLKSDTVKDDVLPRKIMASQKTTLESYVITSTEELSTNDVPQEHNRKTNVGKSLVRTRRSIEIITERTEMNYENVDYFPEAHKCELNKYKDEVYDNDNGSMPPITPISRMPGPVLKKKAINFEAAAITIQEFSKDEPHKDDDIFFTPCSTPIIAEPKKAIKKELVVSNLFHEISQLRRPSIKDYQRHNTAAEHDNNIQKPEDSQPSSSIWSLVTSVIGRSSDKVNVKQSKENQLMPNCVVESTAFVKRYASMAAAYVALPKISKLLSGEDHDDSSNLKRKRSYTSNDQTLYFSTINNTNETEMDNSSLSTTSTSPSTSLKRMKIYGRKPIKRMQSKS